MPLGVFNKQPEGVSSWQWRKTEINSWRVGSRTVQCMYVPWEMYGRVWPRDQLLELRMWQEVRGSRFARRVVSLDKELNSTLSLHPAHP